jgi:hypothetical protein
VIARAADIGRAAVTDPAYRTAQPFVAFLVEDAVAARLDTAFEHRVARRS